MVTVSDLAAAAIHHLLERARAPEDAGLRIAFDPSACSLKVSVVWQPAPQDAVIVAAAGTRVFLDGTAAKLLDDKVLDIVLGQGGRVGFVASTASAPGSYTETQA